MIRHLARYWCGKRVAVLEAEQKKQGGQQGDDDTSKQFYKQVGDFSALLGKSSLRVDEAKTKPNVAMDRWADMQRQVVDSGRCANDALRRVAEHSRCGEQLEAET